MFNNCLPVENFIEELILNNKKIVQYGSKADDLILHMKNLLYFYNNQHLTDLVESSAVLLENYSEEVKAYVIVLMMLHSSGLKLEEPFLRLDKLNNKKSLIKKEVK